MTPQQAVGLASRLFAIWLALGAFQSWMVVRAVHAEGLADAGWLQYSVPAIYWIAAVLLWFFPMSIAHRLVPRTRFEDRLALPPQQVVVVACVVLGLCIVLLRALPALASWLAAAVLYVGAGQRLSAMDAARHAGLLEGLVQLLAGLACVFKAHALAARIAPAGVVGESIFPAATGDTRL